MVGRHCAASPLPAGRFDFPLSPMTLHTFTRALVPIVACLSAGPGLAFELTEEDALRMLRDSPHYRELRARVDVVRAISRRDTLYPNPTASLALEGAGRTEFYLVEQPLAVNGRRNLLRRAGEMAVAAEEARAERGLQKIEAALREAFHGLIFAQRRERAIRRAVGEMDGLARSLRLREEAGEGSRFDRLRAEREVAELHTERARAQAMIAESQAGLASYLGDGVEADTLVADGPPGPLYPLPDLHEAISEALSARGDFRVESDRLEELGFRARAAERRRLPNPVVAGGLKRADTGRGLVTGPVLSVAVGLPLFDKGQAERRVLEAEAAEARARSEAVERRIRAEVRAAHASLRIRRQIAETYRAESSRPAEEIRRIADVAYREGELGILELVESYRVLHETAVRLLELEADARRAEVRFDMAVARDLLP